MVNNIKAVFGRLFLWLNFSEIKFNKIISHSCLLELNDFFKPYP